MNVQARFAIVEEEDYRAYPFEWYLVLRQDEVESIKRVLAPEVWSEYLLDRSDNVTWWGWAGCCPLKPLEPVFPGLTEEVHEELQRQGAEWQRWFQSRSRPDDKEP